MTYVFQYDDLLARCNTLSSYEGRNAVSANGESDYLKTKISNQDETLVRMYLQEGAHLLEDIIGGKIIASSEYGDDSFTWMLDIDTERWSRDDTMSKSIMESVSSYAMKMWMDYNDKPKRAETYEQIWQSMSAQVRRMAYRKTKPVLT